VIGSHADVGMISGGGSAQVDPPGGNAIAAPGKGATHWQEEIWFPTSPLKAIQARAPKATVKYDSGDNPAAAAALAGTADVAVVFAYQWESEGMDLASLSLQHNQDVLIAQVASANPHTVVVLETGSPVTMPWVAAPAAIVESLVRRLGRRQCAGQRAVRHGEPERQAAQHLPQERGRPASSHGHAASAGVRVLGQPGSPEQRAGGLPPFPVSYDEGLKVGYKWYDAEKKPVLFPFGFGLSYTSFRYSALTVTPLSMSPGAKVKVTFTLANTGARAGAEIAEVYASLRPARRNRPSGWWASARCSSKPERSARSAWRSTPSTCPSSTSRRTAGRWFRATPRFWSAVRHRTCR